MKGWLLAGAFVTSVGACGVGCFNKQKCAASPTAALRVTAPELERRYQAVWNSVETPTGLSPHRELFQLGMPTKDAAVVWHAYADGVALTAPNIVIVPAVAPTCIHRFDSKNTELQGAAVPQGSFRTERIVVSCLPPDTEIAITANNKTLHTRTAPVSTGGVAGPMSFVAYSCNNPYDNRRGESAIEAGKLNEINLLERRASGHLKVQGLPDRPTFGVALGDQLYVDGDNENPKRKPEQTLALFQGNDSAMTFDSADSAKLLNIVYRYHFAMPPLDSAMQSLPVAMVWDDHDIRDGWGSHNDESNGDMRNYFAEAKDAFASFQAMRNPDFKGAGASAFDSAFDWSSKMKFFLVDGRSHRTYGPPERPNAILSNPQFCEIATWLGEPCDDGAASVATPAEPAKDEPPTLFVLGLPTPISAESKPLARAVHICEASFTGEGADDIRDTWFCSANDRTRLLRLLANHFRIHKSHRLLIVSGDVHYSAVIFLSLPARNGESARVFGHEIVSSGLANDHKKGWKEIMGVFDGATLTDETGKEPIIQADARGSFFGSPSFVEIVTNFVGPNGVPDVQAVFYPSRASRNTEENSRRNLVNLVTALEEKEIRTEVYDFDVGARAGRCRANAKPPLARIPLPMSVPTFTTSSPRNCMHAASVVCDTGIDSSDAATDWGRVLSPSSKMRCKFE